MRPHIREFGSFSENEGNFVTFVVDSEGPFLYLAKATIKKEIPKILFKLKPRDVLVLNIKLHTAWLSL